MSFLSKLLGTSDEPMWDTTRTNTQTNKNQQSLDETAKRLQAIIVQCQTQLRGDTLTQHPIAILPPAPAEESMSAVVPSVAALSAGNAMLSNAEIIAQIHHAFHTAGDSIVLQAKELLAKADMQTIAKAERLSNLGFTAAQNVQRAVEEKMKADAEKAKMELILRYSISYPSYRFIDAATITAICTKYSLVFGEASDYQGFVPEKNLKEMEAFPGVKEEDEVFMARYVGRYSLGTYYGKWEEHERSVFMRHYAHDGNYQTRSSKTYMICAPLKDMNMEGKTLDGVNVTPIGREIPDPVVLVPMKGGLFCILTAWGEEASDPLVINPQHN